MEQRQPQQQLNPGVVNGIARLEDPRCREERHKLMVHGLGKPPINRQSLEHLVNFLDGGSHEVTEIMLTHVQLSDPPDGGVNVLRDFFARSDTTLTKVKLDHCDFGATEDASRLLAAFHTNRTVSDLTIEGTKNLRGAALGACLSSLVHNMPQLQRLACYYGSLRVEGVRAFQPGLRSNRTLKELDIYSCDIGDEGIRLIADALVGNTTMQILNIGYNDVTSNGLDDITRLIESTRLQSIDWDGNLCVFNSVSRAQKFSATLNSTASIQELPEMGEDEFPEGSGVATFAIIKNSLTRNQQLNRVNLLLAPPPPTPPLQRQQRNYQTALMMFKTWHKAITKFAMIPYNAGASAIFKLFTARPQLLEKRLKRPASAPATDANTIVTVSQDAPHDTNNDNNNRGGGSTVSRTTICGQKRRRL